MPWGDQILIGIVRRLRDVLVHRTHDFFIGLRAGHRQYLWMCLLDGFAACTQAAGHDHLAVFGECFADRV